MSTHYLPFPWSVTLSTLRLSSSHFLWNIWTVMCLSQEDSGVKEGLNYTTSMGVFLVHIDLYRHVSCWISHTVPEHVAWESKCSSVNNWSALSQPEIEKDKNNQDSRMMEYSSLSREFWDPGLSLNSRWLFIQPMTLICYHNEWPLWKDAKNPISVWTYSYFFIFWDVKLRW